MTTAIATGLPGLTLPGLPAAARPATIRSSGVLLTGAPTLSAHLADWGPLPHLPLAALVAAAEAAGLRGAGGAGFPLHRKLAAFGGLRVGTVVVNGSEGEPTSAKDGALLRQSPHLVIDGAVAAARALGAAQIVVIVDPHRPDALASVSRAAAERHEGVEVRPGTTAFVGGEATAVVNAVSGRDQVPGDLGLPPRRPGRRRRHVLVSNVETFARLALAVRGIAPATALTTVSGAVERPGVYELPVTATLGDAANAAGVHAGSPLVVTGGWHGAWVRWPDAASGRLTWAGLADVGGRWGAGAMVWLPGSLDPRIVLTAMTRVLAAESAGQCGPCVAGLPALADTLARGHDPHPVLAEIDGRGLCAHPSATAAAVRSALATIRGSR
ncbi:MAG: NADH-ubiquinone oxidoreductase-F iron-sulfur binding region domain-containing protein [Candidatus Nanopelagicales bacterium]